MMAGVYKFNPRGWPHRSFEEACLLVPLRPLRRCGYRHLWSHRVSEEWRRRFCREQTCKGFQHLSKPVGPSDVPVAILAIWESVAELSRQACLCQVTFCWQSRPMWRVSFCALWKTWTFAMTAGHVKLMVASSLLIRTRIDNDSYTDVPCERQSVWSYLGSWSWSLWIWHPVGPSATLRRCRRKPPNWERSWRSFLKVFAWSMRSIWFCTPWGGADWWVKVRVANMGRNRPTWSTCNLSCAKNMKKIQREAWIWVSGFSRRCWVS